MPPGCAEGGVELQDLVNQSADVQKEDNVKLSWGIPHVVKEVAKRAAKCYISTGGARFDCLGEMHDLVNQSADVQKEDNVKLSWAPWPCPKKGPWPAPPLCGEGRIEIQYDVNQSEFEQRENNVKSSWAPWPCPKKGPWPAPPLCDEGGVELEDLVNQSAEVQKEDNVKLSLPSIKGAAKKVAQGVKNAAKKVAQGKACVDASVKAGIKVGGKICVR